MSLPPTPPPRGALKTTREGQLPPHERLSPSLPRRLVLGLALCAVGPLGMAACGDDTASSSATGETGEAGPADHFELVVGPSEAQPAQSQPEIRVRVVDVDGRHVAGAQFNALVELGGGEIEGLLFTSEAEGTRIPWTLGPAPVPQRVHIVESAGSLGIDSLDIDVDAFRESPATSTPFGDVEGYLVDQGIDSTTEDLAFAPNGRILMGAGPNLLDVDSNGLVSNLSLTGDPVGAAIGVAYNAQEQLFVADGGANTLLRVEPSGAVSTLATTNGEVPLEGPNYVAIAPTGEVLVSDPCLGQIIAYDPNTGAVRGTLSTELVIQGGPSGIAVSPDGDYIYFVTENTALVCGHASFVDILADNAGLYRADLNLLLSPGGSEVQVEELFAGIGQYGDGLGFDVDGNLHFIMDTAENGVLYKSLVMVLPNGINELRTFLQAPTGAMYANLAFGESVFGETNMYISLLEIPGLPLGVTRGLHSAPVGIRGQPLLPTP